jgi:hypothetical protein
MVYHLQSPCKLADPSDVCKGVNVSTWFNEIYYPFVRYILKRNILIFLLLKHVLLFVDNLFVLQNIKSIM